MATTGADLIAYVQGTADDTEFAASCVSTADKLITDYIGSADVPAAIIDRAVLEVGSELFHRRQAPNGVAQYDTFGGAPVRVARDPMVGAYPLLGRYVLGFA